MTGTKGYLTHEPVGQFLESAREKGDEVDLLFSSKRMVTHSNRGEKFGIVRMSHSNFSRPVHLFLLQLQPFLENAIEGG